VEKLQIQVLIAQFTALRQEILWINESKLWILQMKFAWVAGLVSGISISHDKLASKDVNVVNFVIALGLYSLLSFDFVFWWLNAQVETIGGYIRTCIEPPLKTISRLDGGVKLWEEVFAEKKLSHGPYLDYGFKVASATPLVFAWVYISSKYTDMAGKGIKAIAIAMLNVSLLAGATYGTYSLMSGVHTSNTFWNFGATEKAPDAPCVLDSGNK
jgi:hypothetical protein